MASGILISVIPIVNNNNPPWISCYQPCPTDKRHQWASKSCQCLLDQYIPYCLSKGNILGALLGNKVKWWILRSNIRNPLWHTYLFQPSYLLFISMKTKCDHFHLIYNTLLPCLNFKDLANKLLGSTSCLLETMNLESWANDFMLINSHLLALYSVPRLYFSWSKTHEILSHL